jgi:hypothetical protein
MLGGEMQAEMEHASSRDLKREMRMNIRMDAGRYTTLPESVLWSRYLELRKRGEPDADQLLIRGLRGILERRTYASSNLPVIDPDPNEHKLDEDPYLGELFKAYKRCICTHRIQPASQLLRDIETQLEGH